MKLKIKINQWKEKKKEKQERKEAVYKKIEYDNEVGKGLLLLCHVYEVLLKNCLIKVYHREDVLS